MNEWIKGQIITFTRGQNSYIQNLSKGSSKVNSIYSKYLKYEKYKMQ